MKGKRYMVQLSAADTRKVELLHLKRDWPYSLVLREAAKRGLPALLRQTKTKGRIS